MGVDNVNTNDGYDLPITDPAFSIALGGIVDGDDSSVGDSTDAIVGNDDVVQAVLANAQDKADQIEDELKQERLKKEQNSASSPINIFSSNQTSK